MTPYFGGANGFGRAAGLLGFGGGTAIVGIGDNSGDFGITNASGNVNIVVQAGGNVNLKGSVAVTNRLFVGLSAVFTNGTILLSNAWSTAASITNVMPNFATAEVSSNGFPVKIYMSNAVPFIYYETPAQGGILP